MNVAPPPSIWVCGDTIKKTGIRYLEEEQYTLAPGFMSYCNIYKALWIYPLEIPHALYLPIPWLSLADLKDDIPNVHDKLIHRGKANDSELPVGHPFG